MTEHDEQAALFSWSKRFERKLPQLKMLYSIPNGGHRHKVVAVKMKAEGVKPGVPDVCLSYPVGMIPGMYIEMKYGDNKPTDSQIDWLSRLKEAGYYTCVCYSWEDAAREICNYLRVDPAEYGLN
jgi:hypothetical protein